MQAEVLIIGGGLSGLHTAYALQERGIRFLLVESRDRFGGRILSSKPSHSKYELSQAAFDLGPSWFWPGQSHMHELISELGLTENVFMQPSVGDSLYEDNQGKIQRGVAGVSMQGAYRMQGGMQKITDTMVNKISSDSLLINAVVSEVEFKQDQVVSTVLVDGLAKNIATKRVVLALPPRVALATIKFNPQFSKTREDELNAIATWMAGHAKFIAVYKNKFWNEAGFSGDVISHRGPLQEIHDASSENAEVNALFGFFSVPAQYRKDREDELRAMAIAQLVRLFGEAAAEPIEVYVKDWALDSHTSTSYDQEILQFHPANDIVNATENTWQQKLIWSGSESADYRNNNNGFLEGALEASLATVSNLTS